MVCCVVSCRYRAYSPLLFSITRHIMADQTGRVTDFKRVAASYVPFFFSVHLFGRLFICFFCRWWLGLKEDGVPRWMSGFKKRRLT